METFSDAIELATDPDGFLLSDLAHEFECCVDGI